MITGKAVTIHEPGGPEVLAIQPFEVRDPGPGEVRVAVAAAGLNRADCLQRKGVYPAPPGYPDAVPGLELAGTVEAVGEGVRAFAEGDRVMAIIGGGGMATHAVLHERELLPVPEGMTLTDAAAIPEVFLTAWDALFPQAELRMGETLLVHAIASGIGTAALQLAQAVGATVIGTSRSQAKLDRCAELGLEHGVETSDGSFVEGVKALAPGGVDVILDTIGAKYLRENLKVAAPRGRVVTIGLLGGVKGEMNLGLMLAKRLSWMGSVLRARPLEEKGTLAQAFRHQALPLFEAGRLKPIVDAVLPMADAAEAHRRMEASETFGKLVLAW